MISMINSLEPGMAFAFGALISAAVVIAFGCICVAWDHAGAKLDDLIASEPSTRPTSSARKSGRAS